MECINDRRPRSRGRAYCSRCVRTIPRGEEYRRTTFVDGGDIWDVLGCRHCEAAMPYVSKWADDPHYEESYGPGMLWEWSAETMDDCGGVPWGMFAGPSSLAAAHLRALAENAADCGAADADPARAWDDAAWAAFTWRMRTSTAMNAA